MRRIVLALLLIASAGAAFYYRETHLGAQLSDKPVEYVALRELPDDESGMLRILAVGDIGTGDWRQRRVANAMEELAARTGGVDQVLLLGDLFYRHGLNSVDDDRWRTGFAEMYTGALLEASFRPVIGNHDIDGSIDVLVERSKLDPRWAMEGTHYSFARSIPSDDPSDVDAEVAFFAINTVAMVISEKTANEELEWLEDELAPCTARWRVVFGHHPIDSGGHHGGEAILKERLIPILRKHQVDLYLAGHDHYLALLETQGIHAVVSGSGAKVREAAWTPSTQFAATRLGFSRLLFSPETAFVQFYESSGELLYSKRITKASHPKE